MEVIKKNFENFGYILTLKERDVITLRFGIKDGKRRTLQEIGNLFGVTKERIRQIEADAFRKLRHPELYIILKKYSLNRI
jgi:RNA polymerase primary sigma factor